MHLFEEQQEQEAIERILKFAKIANAMGLEIRIGFSGGKDSQVVYDLCKRSGIDFKAYFNHSFESQTTLKFIRDNYPDVIRRRDYKYGFIENIRVKHKGMLPTVYTAYCCQDFKHNPKFVDKCIILGIRKEESRVRANRTAFMVKNKTEKKKIETLVSEYFKEQCQSVGGGNLITLHPIVDWSDEDVWSYIYRHNLPINPEYEHSSRVGCVVCPKASFARNFHALMKYPKLINAFIWARSVSTQYWIITGDNKDYADDKVYYICRWLNHSFSPFSKKQEAMYQQVRQNYDLVCKKK